MSKPLYTYSLLQYHHSQALGEVMNIAMMVYFIQGNKLVFIKPDSLARLRYAYPNVSEATIKIYFKAFDEHIQKLAESGEVLFPFAEYGAFRKFIATEFLPEDSSALQFADVRKGVQFLDDQDEVCRQLKKTFYRCLITAYITIKLRIKLPQSDNNRLMICLYNNLEQIIVIQYHRG